MSVRKPVTCAQARNCCCIHAAAQSFAGFRLRYCIRVLSAVLSGTESCTCSLSSRFAFHCRVLFIENRGIVILVLQHAVP